MGGDTASIVNEFIEQTGITFPVGWDMSNSYSTFPNPGSISPFPLDVVVDRNGIVAYINRQYDPEGLKLIIEQLAAQ